MFCNLIESSSHAREFKRRGSFFLFATLVYALLFVVAGVVSISSYLRNLPNKQRGTRLLKAYLSHQ